MSASKSSFSVIIIEDHDLVRDVLSAMVVRSDRLTLAGEAGDGNSALSLMEQRQADLAIVDFALPDMTGLEVIASARRVQPDTRYLILTGSPMDQQERARLAEFAEGFMHKEAGRDALLSMIIETAEKPPLGVSGPTPPDTGLGLANVGALTKRERSVLREIARGNSVDQMADALGISPSTVRKHRENVMAKLKLNSTAQLVRAAMQIGQY